MNQILSIPHPIALGKKVRAMRPSCPCRGAKLELVEGTVQKVIQNQGGWWYYLSTGVTIKAQWVTMVS